MTERISRTEYFLRIADIVSLRSTCPRSKVGAVVVSGNRIISAGYNGAPSGWPHCNETGCLLGIDASQKETCYRCIHAEANAIVRVSFRSGEMENLIIFSTHKPCHRCYLLIAARGIGIVYYERDYEDPFLDLILEANKKYLGVGNKVRTLPPGRGFIAPRLIQLIPKTEASSDAE